MTPITTFRVAAQPYLAAYLTPHVRALLPASSPDRVPHAVRLRAFVGI